MKRKRKSREEITKKPRANSEELTAGRRLEEAVLDQSMSLATYQRWKSEYGGMKTDGLMRSKELQKENAVLKRVGAELTIGKIILKE